jgi:hypothetical protein
MNQGIKELAEKACMQTDCWDISDSYIEKLSELIMQECIKILADNSEFRACALIIKYFKE